MEGKKSSQTQKLTLCLDWASLHPALLPCLKTQKISLNSIADNFSIHKSNSATICKSHMKSRITARFIIESEFKVSKRVNLFCKHINKDLLDWHFVVYISVIIRCSILFISYISLFIYLKQPQIPLFKTW